MLDPALQMTRQWNSVFRTLEPVFQAASVTTAVTTSSGCAHLYFIYTSKFLRRLL